MQQPTKYFDRLGKNNFLIIGRAGLDLYPNVGIKIEQATQFNAALGGSSANIAVALCRLGSQATLLSTLSNDAIGYYCKNQLLHYGVGIEYLRIIDDESRISLAVYETRIKQHQSVIYRNNAADFQMYKQDVEAADYSRFAAVIITGTVFAAEPSRQSGYEALKLARQNGLINIFDIDYRPYSWASAATAAKILHKAVAMCNIIIGNDVEFDFTAGGQNKGLSLAREIGLSNDKIVVYKMGERGTITITGGNEFATGIYPVQAIKPTGAGDSFMGSFIAALAKGDSLEYSVKRGAAAAAIVVSKLGCAPAMPDSHILDEFMATHNIDTITHHF